VRSSGDERPSLAASDGVDLAPLREATSAGMIGWSQAGRRQWWPIGAADDATPFRVASLTKLVTAAALVDLSRRTGAALDTPLIELLPSLRADWRAHTDLTIAHVLSQTSGLNPSVTGEDIDASRDDESALMDAARLVVRAGSALPAGRRWEYYNGNYILGGAALAALSGTTYEDAIDQLALRRWGLRSTGFDAPAGLAHGRTRPSEQPLASYPRGRRPSGGLFSTANDLVTLGEGLMSDNALLSVMTAVQTRPGDPMRYGLGWAVGPSGQLYLNGRLPGYRAAMLMVPEAGLVCVALAASSDALPALARVLDGLQRPFTGDELARDIEAFAS
jgi:CubicO group peptidase (beta-lactamase class C family)